MKKCIDNVLIIKVGTNTLITKQSDGSECLDLVTFAHLGEQVINLKKQDYHVVIVSSAAITAGMVATGSFHRPTEVAKLQRLASIGWRHVLNAWDSALGDHTIGELLLTKQELELPTERDEVLRVTYELMSHGNVVVANENDAITHAEITFGDNDTLAATFAAKIRRSTYFGNNVRLIILSDVDGVYEDVSNSNTLIRKIRDVALYDHLAHGTTNNHSTGGMITKFEAAKIATANGVEMYIANGKSEYAIERAIGGEIGTHFTISHSKVD